MKTNNLLESRKQHKLLSTISLILVVFLSVSILSACGNEELVEVEKTPIELLTEKELLLFEALKKISADFYEPAGVKLMEVGDYEKFDETSLAKRFSLNISRLEEIMGVGTFNCIIVKLQGENRVGGTLNHYYLVRLDSFDSYIIDNLQEYLEDHAESLAKHYWDRCKSEEEYPKKTFDSRQEYKDFIKKYDGNKYCSPEDAKNYIGNTVELGDHVTIETNNEDIFNISKINKALKYYWDERLGNT
ncbi:MAG: hypothetical protein IKB02_10320 [Clostridia bacterium]|nr:hypothetical protein [Clostridia bacterium]MBR2389128.1 hypothetical protein [Clostridia bacterium]